jgi:hypothetical protein
MEMTSNIINYNVLLICSEWLGIIPKDRELGLLKALACPAMLIPMLFRLDLYTGNHAAHHMQATESHQHHGAHMA